MFSANLLCWPAGEMKALKRCFPPFTDWSYIKGCFYSAPHGSCYPEQACVLHIALTFMYWTHAHCLVCGAAQHAHSLPENKQELVEHIFITQSARLNHTGVNVRPTAKIKARATVQLAWDAHTRQEANQGLRSRPSQDSDTETFKCWSGCLTFTWLKYGGWREHS